MLPSPCAETLPKTNYRVVVCDDERYIVHTTAMLLRMQTQWDLDVQVFTSSMEALAFSHEHRVDLLISDIRMPELDGLALMHAVMDRWPGCQAVMLTAHSQFDYVYDAIQRDQVSYVLKCDGHDALLSAVDKRMQYLETSLRQRRMAETAKKQVDSALPYLRREWLMDLLRGTVCPEEKWREMRQALSLPLALDQPFSAVLMLVQVYEQQDTFLEHSQRMELITGLFQQSLPTGTVLLSVPMDRRRILCLLQGRDGAPLPPQQLEGVLELLQQSALVQLSLPFSIVYDPQVPGYAELAARYERMRCIHSERAACQEDIWLMRSDSMPAPSAALLEQHMVSKAKTWRHAFENGDPLADEMLEQLLARLTQEGPAWRSTSIELYLQLALNIASILRSSMVSGPEDVGISLTELLQVSSYPDTLSAAAYLRQAVGVIRRHRTEAASNELDQTVRWIQAYVHDHLNEDLNISLLAEQAGLNASYLSRLFRKATGETLISYVTRARVQYACSLLEDPEYQIKQVSQQLGFWNPSYFSFFFKKNTGMSPSEYRERHAR